MSRGGLLVGAACLLATTGCGRYAEFTLPVKQRVYPVERRWSWAAENNPQIARGEMVDVLNPVVVEHAQQYWNFYSVFDGKTWHTALATSPDGKTWTKQQAKVLSPDPATWEGNYIAANGDALRVKDEFWMWYQAGPMGKTRIGFARSKDGKTWTKHPAPVVDFGPRGAWDEISLGDVDVYAGADGAFYLYYLGEDRARRQRLGVARSTDGVRWEKLRTNPVLELGKIGAFDEQGLGEPNVWRMSDGEYWMIYTGRNRAEIRRMGLARSADGVRWEKVSDPVIAGQSWWNNKVVCDASVLAKEDSPVRVWYGGGTVAHPAERINGQIGHGELSLK